MKKNNIENKNDTMTIEDALRIQDDLKRDIDFNKPDSELTEDERIKKILFNAFDNTLEEQIGKDKKAEIDKLKSSSELFEKSSNNINNLIEVGRKTEESMFMLSSFLRVHFDKGEKNTFKNTINNATTDIVNPESNLSKGKRMDTAEQILSSLNGYRQINVKEISSRLEIIPSFLETMKRIIGKTNWEKLDEMSKEEEVGYVQMRDVFLEWIELSEIEIKSHIKGFEALKLDINMDELIPKYIIENRGDISMSIKSNEIFVLGNRVTSLIKQANEEINEISDKKTALSEWLFGKPESYMEIMKNVTPSNNTDENLPKSSSKKIKWLVLFILTCIALFGGVWTAIGVFVLGFIAIGLLSGESDIKL